MNRTEIHRREWFKRLALTGGLAASPVQLDARSQPPEPIPVTGIADPDFACLDRMMSSFIGLFDIPGGALAVTRDRKLLYARGFGYADREAQTRVQPETLFRIASVSKPITAVAVMQLVERGDLKLTDRAFEILKLEPHLPKGVKADARLGDITILQLLQHTAGWDRTKSGDPMFQSVEIAKALGVEPPASANHVIRYIMGKPLDFDPGERFAYSNLGYCILGRIIEQVRRKPYEAFVRDETLRPLQIVTMRVGRTLEKDRFPNEAKYYDALNRTGPAVVGNPIGRSVPMPYGASALEPMDSHGGWIASVIDLARFAVAFDSPQDCPILNEKSIQTMFARPHGGAGVDDRGRPRSPYYSCGWFVRPMAEAASFNTWHGGALSGSASWLVRLANGINWIALFNTMDTPKAEYLGNLIDFYGNRAISKITHWPDRDLFKEYSTK